MNIKPLKRDLEIERAIIMAVDCIRENCRNKKPLILHSVRVGMKLLELNQSKEAVIAGILHDLVEDTNVTIERIEKEFGLKVASLVLALTQEKIADYQQRWHILLEKIKKAGIQAMIIKIVDNNDNLIYFFPLLKGNQTIREIIWKQNFTIESLKPYLAGFNFFEEYRQNLKRFVQGFKKRAKTR